jgi:hypothetical protein
MSMSSDAKLKKFGDWLISTLQKGKNLGTVF